MTPDATAPADVIRDFITSLPQVPGSRTTRSAHEALAAVAELDAEAQRYAERTHRAEVRLRATEATLLEIERRTTDYRIQRIARAGLEDNS